MPGLSDYVTGKGLVGGKRRGSSGLVGGTRRKINMSDLFERPYVDPDVVPEGTAQDQDLSETIMSRTARVLPFEDLRLSERRISGAEAEDQAGLSEGVIRGDAETPESGAFGLGTGARGGLIEESPKSGTFGGVLRGARPGESPRHGSFAGEAEETGQFADMLATGKIIGGALLKGSTGADVPNVGHQGSAGHDMLETAFNEAPPDYSLTDPDSVSSGMPEMRLVSPLTTSADYDITSGSPLQFSSGLFGDADAPLETGLSLDGEQELMPGDEGLMGGGRLLASNLYGDFADDSGPLLLSPDWAPGTPGAEAAQSGRPMSGSGILGGLFGAGTGAYQLSEGNTAAGGIQLAQGINQLGQSTGMIDPSIGGPVGGALGVGAGLYNALSADTDAQRIAGGLQTAASAYNNVGNMTGIGGLSNLSGLNASAGAASGLVGGAIGQLAQGANPRSKYYNEGEQNTAAAMDTIANILATTAGPAGWFAPGISAAIQHGTGMGREGQEEAQRMMKSSDLIKRLMGATQGLTPQNWDEVMGRPVYMGDVDYGTGNIAVDRARLASDRGQMTTMDPDQAYQQARDERQRALEEGGQVFDVQERANQIMADYANQFQGQDTFGAATPEGSQYAMPLSGTLGQYLAAIAQDPRVGFDSGDMFAGITPETAINAQGAGQAGWGRVGSVGEMLHQLGDYGKTGDKYANEGLSRIQPVLNFMEYLRAMEGLRG